MKQIVHVLGLMLFCLAIGCQKVERPKAYVVRVSPGTSLHAVRDSIRALPASNKVHGVEVVLESGLYALEKSLVLDARDSGCSNAPIVWRGVDVQARPRLVGGVSWSADSFKPVTDPVLLARLDVSARGKVLEADISKIRFSWPGKPKIPCERFGLLPVPDVFVDGKRLALASYPAAGWSEMVKIIDRGSEYGDRSLAVALQKGFIKVEDLRGGTFQYKEDRPSRWAANPHVAIQAFWRYDWRDTIIYAKSIDPAAKTITLETAHSYGIGKGNPAPRRWRALNVFEELNAPGRYAVDYQARKLYVYPPASFKEVGICSASEPLVRVNGAANIVFDAIRFGRSFDADITLSHATNVVVRRSVFTDARGLGVYGAGCIRCRIETCDFHHLGSGGVFLDGGNRRTLERGDNEIVDCLFHHWNVLRPSGSNAAIVRGVGNAIRHCEMYDASHQATGLCGNDGLFEFNVVSNVCKGTDDAGAFYKGRNPSARGNMIRWNYFKDIGRRMAKPGHGASAIYFDDGDGGDYVIGNVFEDAGVAGLGNFAAVFSHGGYSNVVKNCIFLDCQRALGSGAWTQENWAKFLKTNRDSTWIVKALQEEVDIRKPPYTTHYPELVGFLNPHPDELRWNGAWNNAFVNCPLALPDGSGKLTRPGLVSGRWYTNETDCVISGDPGFVNRKAGDLRLRKDSAIYRQIPGFEPIPFEKIGLLTRVARER